MAGDEKPPGYRGGALTKRRRSKWKVKKLTRTTRLPAPYYTDQDVYHNGRALTHVSAEEARQETCECDDGRSCEACQVWLVEVQLNVRRQCPHNDPWHLPSSMWRPYPWQAQSRCAYRDSRPAGRFVKLTFNVCYFEFELLRPKPNAARLSH